jgi:E3 ubiquitin-protein ligase MGRN1
MQIPIEEFKYAIQFRYDSKVAAELQIYACANEEINEQRYPYIKISQNNPSAPTFPLFKIAEGKDQLFSNELAVFDKSMYQESELYPTGKLKSYYPMIIMLKALYPLQVQIKYQLLYTYAKIINKSGQLELKAVAQKLLVVDKIYQLYDIYGTESNVRSSNEGSCKECVICFTNMRDTLVIPCRHLCLCSECSYKMREQRTKNCPLCRTSKPVIRHITIHYYKDRD